MKGLELCRRFFCEWGLPFIQREFPELTNRVAASRTNGDSDTIGADDELSRDHGWGPHFDICLTAEDYKRSGRRLSTAMNRAAPESFLGCRYADFGRPCDKVVVTSIDRYFSDYLLGWKHPPESNAAWFRPRGGETLIGFESQLYFLKHGEVFYDPLGEFSSRRAEWSQFPPDIYYYRLNGECFHVWHCGLYNLCRRQVRRKDPWAVKLTVARFMEAAMRVFLLLHRGFSPYYKWLAHEFRKLPESRTVGPKLEQLVSSCSVEEQAHVVGEVYQFLHRRLVAEGIIEDGESLGPNCAVKKWIEDQALC